MSSPPPREQLSSNVGAGAPGARESAASAPASLPEEVGAGQLESLVASRGLSNVASSSAPFGCRAVYATDEWFATADCLLASEPPVFLPDLYCPQGKVMDGWETRRKRVAGHDWAVFELGMAASEFWAVEVDTAHFTGNHAPRISLEVADLSSLGPSSRWMPGADARRRRGGGVQGTGQAPAEVEEADAACRAAGKWTCILPQTPLRPGYEGTSVHRFVLSDGARARAGAATHVRLNYYPDGGVARLRLWATSEAAAVAIPSASSPEHIPLPRPISATSVVSDSVYEADAQPPPQVSPPPLEIESSWEAHSSEPYPHPELSSSELGGIGLACSNKHFGVPSNLIQPTYGKDMGDGWETARHPDRPAVWAKDPETGLLDTPLTDWAILKLGTPARLGVSRIVLDTRHFRGNFPESVQVEGCFAATSGPGGEATEEEDAAVCDTSAGSVVEWFPLLPRTKMRPDAEHLFCKESITNSSRPVTHCRVTIYPDGGLSRVRIYAEDVPH